jgi:mannose-6-phosphate isomerase-like protein (cupin superfamily)
MDGSQGCINLAEKLSQFDELWSPRIVADVNDYQVKLVKVLGDFPEHHHDDTDELFLVLAGELQIRLPGETVTLAEGDLFVVPRGMSHQPYSPGGASLLVLEPAGTMNRGSAGGPASTSGERL